MEHLRGSLLSGMNTRLIGEVTGEPYNYRHSVFSFASGVEEIANVILTFVSNSEIENKTLGQKLGEVRDLFAKNPKYFVNADTLEHLTRLMTEVRNTVVHPTQEAASQELTAIQSYLSAQLSLTFLQFTIKTLGAFLDQDGKLVNVKIIEEPPKMDDNTVYYFGLDGDATGDYIEKAFDDSAQDEEEVLKRSQTIRDVIKEVRNLVCKRTKNNESIIFAEGDNILFKAHYSGALLSELQTVYKKRTGLCSSIGFGKTLREATIAMRLSKAQSGDSIIGVTFIHSE